MDQLTFIFGHGVEGLPAEEAARCSNRNYVRSEGGLAVYEESRNPTGHVLTAWEAYTTFGADILEEAVEYSSAILNETSTATEYALRNRREELGLSLSSVAGAARVSQEDVEAAESAPHTVSIQNLERIAFGLGLDERLLAFKRDPGGDARLAYRLRTLQVEKPGSLGSISAGTALLFAEAASIIRVQHRLQNWLGIQMEGDKFTPVAGYGSPQTPAWRIGYNLAEHARETLQLGNSPVHSMRELVEERLGIPVIQARLPNRIAGATVMTTNDDGDEVRGVVLNTIGDNENVWIRRATLAHELGHLLYDPDEQLQNVRVDSYDSSQRDAEAYSTDYVEQRANAFAIAFLAPNKAVRQLAPTPISEEAVSNVMHTFGISHTAARYHIANCHYRNFGVPQGIIDSEPSYEQTAAENFTVDYFPLHDTPEQRRGRFAGIVAMAYQENFISAHTGALYLNCTVEDFHENADLLRSLYQG